MRIEVDIGGIKDEKEITDNSIEEQDKGKMTGSIRKTHKIIHTDFLCISNVLV